ncbi:MAG: glycosyltransferase family 39 protein [Bdellovibrionales bacterium]|nr:glycosyltransferase family 39 protein [Bdellovibrionales bacterium]
MNFRSTLFKQGSGYWIFVVAVLYGLFQAATLGISDDEAYYWVLSKSPAWGYVYHPPMVAWVIAASDRLLGWIPLAREFLVRVPGLLLFTGTLALGVSWLNQNHDKRHPFNSFQLVLFLIPGLVAMCWMMVPDHPLIFGWMLCFYSCWRILQKDSIRYRDLALLAISCTLGILSKFSAVLFCASATFSILAFSKKKLAPISAVFLGSILGLIPIVYWNSKNEWAAILYQFQARHSGAALELLRYGKFWATQLLIAGPFLIYFGIVFGFSIVTQWKRKSIAQKYLFIWFFPALVFLVQPAFSSFKPHWAIVAWLPLGLAAALESSRNHTLARLHSFFALCLLVIFTIFSHFPATSTLQSWWTGRPANPLWDLSNDLKSWDGLPEFLAAKQVPQDIAVIGARYQTASQAAFSLWPHRIVTLAPRTTAESREWPLAAESLFDRGAGLWPQLHRRAIFVHDDRYLQEPQFPDSICSKIGILAGKSHDTPAKRIHIWDCYPRSN